jgi:acyl-coenzyme A thioesterase 13
MRKPKIPPPCFAFLHAELLSAQDGVAVVRFHPTEGMENPYGTIQGGILAGMLDNIIGPAVVSAQPDRRSATIQMSVNYLDSAKAGDTLLGTARVVRAGRRQAYIEAELIRESDNACLVKATATNVFVGDPVKHDPMGGITA